MQKQIKVYIVTEIRTGETWHFKTMAEFSRKNDIKYQDIRNAQQTVQIKTGKRFPFEIRGFRVEIGVGEWELNIKAK